MADTTVPLEYFDALSDAIDAIVAGGRKAAEAVIRRLIEENPDALPLDIFDQVADMLEPYIEVTSEQTAALSAQSYDIIRQVMTGEALGAEPVTDRSVERTKAAIESMASDHKENTDAFLQAAIDRLDYEAKRAAGRTTFVNGRKDPRHPRFARVPTGSETCRFCVMLASRGFVYHSEKSAGKLDHYHPHCRCRIVPGYDGMEIDGYDPDEYLRLWEQMENENVAKLPIESEGSTEAQ